MNPEPNPRAIIYALRAACLQVGRGLDDGMSDSEFWKHWRREHLAVIGEIERQYRIGKHSPKGSSFE